MVKGFREMGGLGRWICGSWVEYYLLLLRVFCFVYIYFCFLGVVSEFLVEISGLVYFCYFMRRVMGICFCLYFSELLNRVSELGVEFFFLVFVRRIVLLYFCFVIVICYVVFVGDFVFNKIFCFVVDVFIFWGIGRYFSLIWE